MFKVLMSVSPKGPFHVLEIKKKTGRSGHSF